MTPPTPRRDGRAESTAAYDDDYRVRVWMATARYHRTHGHPTAGNRAADVADAIRFYLAHLGSPAFEKERTSLSAASCPVQETRSRPSRLPEARPVGRRGPLRLLRPTLRHHPLRLSAPRRPARARSRICGSGGALLPVRDGRMAGGTTTEDRAAVKTKTPSCSACGKHSDVQWAPRPDTIPGAAHGGRWICADCLYLEQLAG